MSKANNLSEQALVNIQRDESLIHHFAAGVGRKALILSPSFPFLFIGEIKGIDADYIEMFVETTHYAQLENRIWDIHIHQVEAFFIERDGGPQIPEIKDE